ncbi:MFS transporter [Streptomyces sp. ID05-04B]|uniref:MFS transporter n=1 Tax=Streptomyces sp. ID05-04B TaxID=3028661 RepID=UPI0029C4FC15|nr:MFS transporter [Streptomyces sp. ID05-04B]MDX5565487.1 MFS transporter [Streptomyces sp. ID05-04B]
MRDGHSPSAGGLGGPKRPGPPVGPLARAHRDLRILWWVNAVDGLGSQASGLVLPLLLLELGHGPGTAGSLAGVAALTGVVLGPLLAIPADRGRRRRLMTWSAALAALATGALALACLGRPALWVVVSLALAERLCAVAYEAASRGALVHLAAIEELPRAAAGMQMGDQVSLIAGPALGGALFQLARPVPFLADALTYMAVALGVRAVRTPLDTPVPVPAPGPVSVPPPRAPSGTGTDADADTGRRATWTDRLGTARAGVVTVAASPVLRLVLVWTSTAGGALTLLFYTALFRLGGDARSAAAGLVLAAAGAAGLVGSLVAAPVVRRLGAARLLTLAAWLLPIPCASLVWAHGAIGWGAAFAGLSLLVPLITVVLSSVAVACTPVALQSRTASVLGSASALAAASAPALAGFLVTAGNLRTPALLCTALFAALAVYTQLRAPAVLRAGAAAAHTTAGTGDGRG